MNSETERLRRLRERVEAQELKLRKLRALRGQSDQQRVNNNALSEYRIQVADPGPGVLVLRPIPSCGTRHGALVYWQSLRPVCSRRVTDWHLIV